jgi:hypothetical protein
MMKQSKFARTVASINKNFWVDVVLNEEEDQYLFNGVWENLNGESWEEKYDEVFRAVYAWRKQHVTDFIK